MTDDQLTRFLDRLAGRLFGVALVLVFVTMILAALA